MYQINDLLNIYTSIGSERKPDKLLNKILQEAIHFTNADGGILYLFKEESLHCKVLSVPEKSFFLHLDTESSSKFPPISMHKKSPSTSCLKYQKILYVEDIHQHSNDFLDFFPSSLDFHPKSMLLFPIRDDAGAISGVVSLLSMEKPKNYTLSDPHYHGILELFGVQAGISYNNITYTQENLEQLHSFVEVLTTAIDTLSKFNANHSRNMVKYAEKFMDWLEKENNPLQFSKKDRQQLIMSVRLHDIGKLTTPQHILNKSSRLGPRLDVVTTRIEKLTIATQLAFHQNIITKEEYTENLRYLESAPDQIQQANTTHHLSDQQVVQMTFLGTHLFVSGNNTKETVLQPEELDSLAMQYGNITTGERKIMENHVVMTETMLSKIKFAKNYEDVPKWAAAHHEVLNGEGYPNHLTENSIPKEVRILTVLDIFEALVATDRPYKSPKSVEEACEILHSNVKEGRLDPDIVDLFIESKPWL